MIFLPLLVWPCSNQSAVSWPAEIRPTCKETELPGIHELSTKYQIILLNVSQTTVPY